MMGNVLITGLSGFLGTVLNKELNDEDTTRIVSIGGNNRIDISNPFELRNDESIDTVVHAAGKAHFVPKTQIDKQEFYRVNVEGTKNLCRALERLDQLPESFIFISTVAVYGVDEGEFIDERHPLKGVTPYAESKILAEEWLRKWANDHNVALSILRLPLIAGHNPPGNLGAMIRGIKSGKYLSIGQANARKSIVWAYDVANIIPRLAKKSGIYNLTDGYHPTFGELETSIALALNKRKPPKVPYWAAKILAGVGDIAGSRFPIDSNKLRKITSTLTFDDAKARNELGWNPTGVLNTVDEWVKP